MKRIASLFLVLCVFVSISCRRSNNEGAQQVTISETPPADAESHTGTVELVKKTELKGIKTMALASGISSLLVSDGTIVGKQGVDLEILSLSDLKRTASFTITDTMSGGYPWSSNSMAVAPNGSNALLYNQYIELKTVSPTVALDIQTVVGRPNVHPEPWSISPNGELALVCVGSYSSHDESTLATFDLANGKFLKKLATGRNTEYGCASFLDNETVASIGYDGVVTIHHLADSTTTVFSEKLTQGPIQGGRNLRLQPFDGGTKLAVTGDDEIFVLDITRQSILFRHPCSSGNAIITGNGKLLLWQNDRLKEPQDPQNSLGNIEHTLFVANIQTGKLVGEYLLPTFYQMIVMDDAAEFIFATHYDELHKLKIDLSPITSN